MVSLIKNSKSSFYLGIAFCLSLLVNFYFVEIIRYGDFQNLFYAFLFIFHNRSCDTKKNIAITILLLLPLYLFTSSGFFSFVSDCIKLFLIFSCVDAFENFNLSSRQGRILADLLLCYAILFLICACFPSFYTDGAGRYRGLFYGGNLSSSVIMLIIAFILEYYKGTKSQVYVTIISLACFLVALFLCNTRTVFFVIPYLLWIYKESINFKKAWPIVLIFTLVAVRMVMQNTETLSSDLRLSTEESSYLTRLYLYEEEFNGIRDAYYVLPHGSGACIEFIQKITHDNTYSPHNDLLSYWYDWGFIWFLVLIYVYKKIKKFVIPIGFGWGSLYLFIFMMSCSLHNILMYINLWLPIVFIMWRHRLIHNKNND